MGRREAELLTDFCRLDAQVLAHQEHLPGARGQPAQAFLERGEELLVLERLLGPLLRRLAPVARGIEQRLDILERRLALGRLLTAVLPGRCDELVLGDAVKPGAT